MSYTTLSSPKNHYFRKEFLHKTIFFLCSYTSARIRQHYFSKYWGDKCMGRPPPQIFWGTVPPVPLGLRHWIPAEKISDFRGKKILTTFFSRQLKKFFSP